MTSTGASSEMVTYKSRASNASTSSPVLGIVSLESLQDDRSLIHSPMTTSLVSFSGSVLCLSYRFSFLFFFFVFFFILFYGFQSIYF
jgi:hypothetical protein